MARYDISGKWALVTGASSGLGVDFARELAARGSHLILVARREELLAKVAGELREQHGVKVECMAFDLVPREAASELYAQVQDKGIEVDILVNNAGFGLFGTFQELSWERQSAMLDLDIMTLVHLTKLFSRGMVARRYGRIMQVASIGAYQSSPTYAAYSAAKSFVLSFGEALNFELRGTGVSCTVVSPGVTATEFLKVSGQKPTLYQRMMMMRSDKVARIGVRAMLKGRSSIVTGFLNALTCWSLRFTPRCIATWMAYQTMKSQRTTATKPLADTSGAEAAS